MRNDKNCSIVAETIQCFFDRCLGHCIQSGRGFIKDTNLGTEYKVTKNCKNIKKNKNIHDNNSVETRTF